MKPGIDPKAEALDTAQMPATMNKPLVMKAMDVLVKMSQDKVERERYESRVKWERDLRQREFDARKEGMKEGRQEGEYYGNIEILQSMLKQPQTPEQDLEKMSLDELRCLADELRQRIERSS